MNVSDVSFVELEQCLARTPVIAEVHPLIPLCFSAQTKVITEAVELLAELDDRSSFSVDPLLILTDHPALRERFPKLRARAHPPVEAINRNFVHQIGYARTHLCTTHHVAEFIAGDIRRRHPELVVVLLVDGLGYGDVLDWPYDDLQPCFVDGPSVTFRFFNAREKRLNSKVGFASIVNQPSIFARLRSQGYEHARGYTYWAPGNNVIADFMYGDIPCQRVVNFDGILNALKRESLPAGTYLQIVREGLDGLAHGKRELQRVEIEGAIQAIRNDIERLMNIVLTKRSSVVLYLTADHGILWKYEHQWQILENMPSSHPRYTENTPPEMLHQYVLPTNNDQQTHYLLRYPYLTCRIPATDSGVHGGLSYQESIVPLLRLKG